MTTTATPAIEKVKAREMSVTLSVDMWLASVPVTVSGQYNIHSNCYYPSSVRIQTTALAPQFMLADDVDLESFCDALNWDYSETHDLIQEAVEKRDQ